MSDKTNSDISPTNPKHPFWSATTGSTLELRLNKPPPSPVHSMIISVHSIIQPYVYKILVRQEDVDTPKELYHKKNDAIKVIKNEWWEYYEDRTEVKFIDHTDVSQISHHNDFSFLSPRRNNIVDSCPPTPSPRSIRKKSLKTMLSKQRKNGHSRNGSTQNGSAHGSPRHSSPLHGSAHGSPRHSSPLHGSAHGSPRNGSPRSPARLGNKLSFHKSPRSSDGSRSQVNSSGSGSGSNSNSTDNSPRDSQSTGGTSPRTLNLLKKASVKLALKLHRNRIKDADESPPTPRNSFNT